MGTGTGSTMYFFNEVQKKKKNVIIMLSLIVYNQQYVNTVSVKNNYVKLQKLLCKGF